MSTIAGSWPGAFYTGSEMQRSVSDISSQIIYDNGELWVTIIEVVWFLPVKVVSSPALTAFEIKIHSNWLFVCLHGGWTGQSSVEIQSPSLIARTQNKPNELCKIVIQKRKPYTFRLGTFINIFFGRPYQTFQTQPSCFHGTNNIHTMSKQCCTVVVSV